MTAPRAPAPDDLIARLTKIASEGHYWCAVAREAATALAARDAEIAKLRALRAALCAALRDVRQVLTVEAGLRDDGYGWREYIRDTIDPALAADRKVTP